MADVLALGGMKGFGISLFKLFNFSACWKKALPCRGRGFCSEIWV